MDKVSKEIEFEIMKDFDDSNKLLYVNYQYHKDVCAKSLERLKQIDTLTTQLAAKDKELADRKSATEEMNLASYVMVEELAQEIEKLKAYITERGHWHWCGVTFQPKEDCTCGFDKILTPTPDPLLDVKGGPDLQPPTGRD